MNIHFEQYWTIMTRDWANVDILSFNTYETIDTRYVSMTLLNFEVELSW